MSDRLKELERQRAETEKRLHDVDVEIHQIQQGMEAINRPLICPKCKTPETLWAVYTTYDPFGKIAWEYRGIKLTCKHCGYELVEVVQTEQGN